MASRKQKSKSTADISDMASRVKYYLFLLVCWTTIDTLHGQDVQLSRFSVNPSDKPSDDQS